MTTRTISATLCRTFRNEPLATVDLPGPGAELTPDALRALAEALQQIAADAEKRPTTGRHYMPMRKDYALTT